MGKHPPGEAVDGALAFLDQEIRQGNDLVLHGREAQGDVRLDAGHLADMVQQVAGSVKTAIISCRPGWSPRG